MSLGPVSEPMSASAANTEEHELERHRGTSDASPVQSDVARLLQRTAASPALSWPLWLGRLFRHGLEA